MTSDWEAVAAAYKRDLEAAETERDTYKRALEEISRLGLRALVSTTEVTEGSE